MAYGFKERYINGLRVIGHGGDIFSYASQMILIPEDNLGFFIALTERNRLLRDRYDQVSREMTELFYEGFNLDEIATFEVCLRRILVNLKKCE